MVTANFTIDGKQRKAIKSGFKISAGYIFGDNKSRENISMADSVRQQSNEKISMTVLVRQQEVLGI